MQDLFENIAPDCTIPDDVVAHFRVAGSKEELNRLARVLKPQIDAFAQHPQYGAGTLAWYRAAWEYYYKRCS